MSITLNGCTALPHLGVLRVEGEDAAPFLHGQLSQDFVLLGPQEARLAAFLSPKGRMLASMVGFKRSANEILLVLSADLLERTRQRLSMFVLRAKVKISDASAEFALYGLAGDAIKTIAGQAIPPWAKLDFEQQFVLGLYPAGGQPRALWLGPAGSQPGAAPALSLAQWQWGEVHSGVATLSAALVDLFVPQMLNYESVGGINFKKGCYPGQEVVARSQFRGTLKRRTYIAHSQAQLTPGQELFQEGEPEQPCGMVLQAAPAPAGGCDALVALQIAAAQAGGLRAGASDGAPLALLALPYPLRDDL